MSSRYDLMIVCFIIKLDWFMIALLAVQLKSPDRSLVLEADTLESKLQWIAAFNTAFAVSSESPFARIILERSAVITGLILPSSDGLIAGARCRQAAPRSSRSTAGSAEGAVGNRLQLGLFSASICFSSIHSYFLLCCFWLQLVIQEKVGDGSFGEVFKGRLWGTEVAIKRLKAAAVQGSLLDDLKREIAILRHGLLLIH